MRSLGLSVTFDAETYLPVVAGETIKGVVRCFWEEEDDRGDASSMLERLELYVVGEEQVSRSNSLPTLQDRFLELIVPLQEEPME